MLLFIAKQQSDGRAMVDLMEWCRSFDGLLRELRAPITVSSAGTRTWPLPALASFYRASHPPRLPAS